MRIKFKRRDCLKEVFVIFIVCWVVLLILIQFRLATTVSPQNQGQTIQTRNLKQSCSNWLLTIAKNNIRVTDTSAIRKLEIELNSGWNLTGLPTKIVVLGTHGYIKRDLPVYAEAFRSKLMGTIQGETKLGIKQPFDSILCLSFNTESCLSKEEFQLVGRNRKVNRIKSLREVLWSKHVFCNTINAAILNWNKISNSVVDFVFPCWVLPEDYEKMVEDSRRLKITRWISKPRSLGAGMGITIIDDLKELRHSKHVVQEYLKKPHLLKSSDGDFHKWDMRTYVLVTSVIPLRAYVYQRGLIRLATSPYSEDCKSRNQTACLTNTSINKKMEGAKLKDITWSFEKLKKYLTPKVYEKLFLKMQRAIGMTLLASLPTFISEWEVDGNMCESCYQLLGVDVIFDDKLNAKVIECNGEPSMQLTGGKSSHYDVTKKNMIKDLVNIVYQEQSASGVLHKILVNRLHECNDSKDDSAKKQNHYLKKSDVSYLLDYFRETKQIGGFSSVYPHKRFDLEYRDFLFHMSNSDSFSKKVQKYMKTILQSHDVFRELILWNIPEIETVVEIESSQQQNPENDVPVDEMPRSKRQRKIDDEDDDDDDDDP